MHPPLIYNNVPSLGPLIKPTFGQIRMITNYYCIFDSSTDSMIIAPPRKEHRAGDGKKVKPPSTFIIKTVQATAEQAPEGRTIPLINGEVSLSNPRVRYFKDNSRPTPNDYKIFMTL